MTLLYNDGYAAILGKKHPNALGRPMQDVWPEAWEEIGPGMSQAMRGIPEFGQDRARPLDRGDAKELAYFTYSKIPIYVEAGRVAGVVCTCQETTSEVHKRESYRAESERLRDLFNKAPGFMVVLRGPDHVFEVVNEAYENLVGPRELVGKSVMEALPEIRGQGYLELLDQVYQTGNPHLAARSPVLLQRTPGEQPEVRLVDFIYQPIRDDAGRIDGIFVQGTDVTEASRSDERKREAERIARSTMDALKEHIAVIDHEGTILATNLAWRAFADSNGAPAPSVSEGANYLKACDIAAATGDRVAAKVADLIRLIARGEQDRAGIEYPCHSPSEERWFYLDIARFRDDGPVRIVLSHENITERRRGEEQIAYLATHDALTELPNRHVLEDRARLAIEQSRRSGKQLAVFFLDLDNFKYLNDAYGHATGDAALKAVARTLRGLVRAGDTVARIGGDEFVLLLNNLSDTSRQAAPIARTVLDRLSRPLEVDGRELTVTTSIGISTFPVDGDSLETLLKNADTAMYRAKSLGRSAYQFYSADMSARDTERVVVEAELRRAIGMDQLSLAYQPQVALRSRRLTGMEALLRWSHPELGQIPPARFISIAEDAGLIGQIGHWALRNACLQNRHWQKQGLSAVPVAVNISAVQLKQPDFIDLVEDVLAETGLDPRYLELEITETAVMAKTDPMMGRLHDLKRIGVRLSIDDFGTGYSNLGYLTSFPLDRLKIDQSFVAGLPRDENGASIVRAILAMGQSLGLAVIAEGVETDEQADLLEEMGCAEAQGYYFGHPVPAEAAKTLLERASREHPLLRLGAATAA
jgi:diguanylate cyclase (GGDEF)-like protein/PAS domain S-box-containing protein